MICYLARHGKDDETLRGGWSQSPLTCEGKTQAEDLANFIQSTDLEIRHISSSDLLRAMQTAQSVAEKLYLPVIPMPEFREVNNGELAGMKNELAAKIYPGLFWNTLGWDQRYPGGESPKNFYERITKAWEAFQKEISERNENVMLVTHGGVINVILSIVNGQEYSNKTAMRKIRNAEMLALEYQSGEWKEHNYEMYTREILPTRANNH